VAIHSSGTIFLPRGNPSLYEFPSNFYLTTTTTAAAIDPSSTSLFEYENS